MSNKTENTSIKCAFLRGVNVKGTAMKMKDVCSVFENTGMTQVSSILATGNIIFCSKKSKQELTEVLEKSMSDAFNYEAFLFIKTKEEIETLWDQNPFIKDPDHHIYIFICHDSTTSLILNEFNNSKKTKGEEVVMIGYNIYWKVQKGLTLESEFGKILGNKKFKNTFTSRNINTIEKIIQKLA